MFSERLKLARKRSGLSLRDLSSNMNGMVSAQAIGKYERGEMMPSSSVAIALANALDVTTTYLLSPTVISLESVEFRKLASTKVRERAMVEAAVLDHVDRYLQVEELLDIASSVWEVPDGAPYHADSVEDGELIAARVREAWNLGGGAIPNMTELLEEHGIKVLKLDFPPGCGRAHLLRPSYRRYGRTCDRLLYRQVDRAAEVHPGPRARALGDGHPRRHARREDLRPVCQRFVGA